MFLDKDVKTKKNRSDKKNQNKDERLIDTKLFYSYTVNKKYLLKTYLLQNQPEYLLNTTSVFIFSILYQEVYQS